MRLEELKFKSGNVFLIKITDMEPIYLEDISVYRLSLKSGMEISDELLEEILYISSREGAKRSAARILSAGGKTESELKSKLNLKGFDEESVEEAVEFMKKNGFLNDLSYAKAYARDGVSLKKYSIRQIKLKLGQKGISSEIISEAVEGLNDEAQLYEILERELEKAPDKKGMEKIKRRLYSKGFSLWDINRVIGELENEA